MRISQRFEVHGHFIFQLVSQGSKGRIHLSQEKRDHVLKVFAGRTLKRLERDRIWIVRLLQKDQQRLKTGLLVGLIGNGARILPDEQRCST
jgi:hypothetical protein